MNQSDIKKMIRDEVARHLNVILSGSAGDNGKVQSEAIESLYPGSPSIPDRPVMHPYGFVSRAPRKTIQVTAKQGADPSNRLILGHRDGARPSNIDEGESLIYSSTEWSVKAKNNGIKLTNKTSTVSIDLSDAGVVIDLGGVGTYQIKNGQGDLIDALLQIFTGSTAAGFPFIANPAGLAIVQSLKNMG